MMKNEALLRAEQEVHFHLEAIASFTSGGNNAPTFGRAVFCQNGRTSLIGDKQQQQEEEE